VTELPLRVATFTLREPGTSAVRALLSTEADVTPRGGEVTLGFVVRNERDVIVASGAERTTTGDLAFSAIVPAGTTN
jgi:hypothetical protein